MKVKRHVYISNPERASSPDNYCYAISEFDDMTEWLLCGEVEFEVNVDTNKLIEKGTAILDSKIGRHTAAINVLENRKAELLALPSPS